MWTNKKYIILAALFTLVVQTSCIDDDIVCIDDVEVPTEITNGYSINLMVTLDKMGGTSSTRSASVAPVADLPEDLIANESYIDPEKFRVLFFDKDDKFLFESKSRWVKKLTQTDEDHTDWFVSIPVFSYGNDTEYDWDWKAIRDKLVNHKFKIAVLANRPGKDVFPELADNQSTDGGDARKWFDNTGPHWKREQTIWYAEQNGNGNLTTAKDVFDLHHSQYDPIYENKNNNLGHYDFIMTYDQHEGEKKPFMSSTSSWVDWGNNLSDDNKDVTFTTAADIAKGKGWRYAIHPSETNPIPMYGIQEFKALGTAWKEGTAFNLARPNDKPISLLRSVVRIELLIPKKKANGEDQKKPDYISLWYSNIYARCEPMDVWTPTDQIWGESLDDHRFNKCEMDAIMNYGPIANYESGASAPANAYQERLSWLYGVWKEKGWKFKNQKDITITVAEETNNTPYPRIFNPCIQRNNTISCVNSWVDNDPNYYRCVVYTGERNVNDPTNLADLQNQGTLLYWAYSFNKGDNYNFYYVPITDYSNPNNPVYTFYEDLTKESKTTTGTVFGPHHFVTGGATDLTGNYMEAVKKSSGKNLPYPLIRNHVYRLILAPTDAKTYTYQWDFTKDLIPATVDNLNADNKWGTPGGGELKTLSINALSNYTNGGASTVDLTWGEGATLTRVNGTIQTGSSINNQTSIKTSGTNILTLPTGKVATEITLYSYVNTSATSKTVFSASPRASKSLNNETVELGNNLVNITGGRMWATSKRAESKEFLNSNYFVLNYSDDGFFKIELNSPLAAGDVISAKIKKDSGGERGIVICQNEKRIVDGPALKVSAGSGDGTSQYIVTGEDGLVGVSTIYLYRLTGNGTSFTDFKITHNDPTNTYWSDVNGNTEKKDMYFYSGQSIYDKYTFTFEPTNKITFTSTGSQICYIAEIRTKSEDGSPRYWEWIPKNPNGEQKANENTIYELQGLKFNSSDGTIYIYAKESGSNENKICVTGTTTITLPHPLEAGYTVTIRGKSSTEFGSPTANSCVITAGSGLTFDTNLSSNATGIFGNNDGCTFTWNVTNNNTTPTFTLSNNGTGIDFYEISVSLPNGGNRSSALTRGANTDSSPMMFKVKSEDLHSKSIRFDNLLKYKNSINLMSAP